MTEDELVFNPAPAPSTASHAHALSPAEEAHFARAYSAARTRMRRRRSSARRRRAHKREVALIEEIREGWLVSDDDEYSEEGDFEEEEGAEGDGAGTKYQLSLSAWVAGRKRSIDELEPEAGAEGGDAHVVKRGRTPPKGARMGERDAGVTDLTDADTARAGSAPKRAQLAAES
ncbi:hypothetical protein FB451DRAFT_1409616 [Mycena latifolia]|nr:hypothetical protein FB451DRAFT_1409616 [Mycena latifolia]